MQGLAREMHKIVNNYSKLLIKILENIKYLLSLVNLRVARQFYFFI